ncbi:unnamed protein product, partial [Linum tenue]
KAGSRSKEKRQKLQRDPASQRRRTPFTSQPAKEEKTLSIISLLLLLFFFLVSLPGFPIEGWCWWKWREVVGSFW